MSVFTSGSVDRIDSMSSGRDLHRRRAGGGGRRRRVGGAARCAPARPASRAGPARTRGARRRQPARRRRGVAAAAVEVDLERHADALVEHAGEGVADHLLLPVALEQLDERLLLLAVTDHRPPVVDRHQPPGRQQRLEHRPVRAISASSCCHTAGRFRIDTGSSTSDSGGGGGGAAAAAWCRAPPTRPPSGPSATARPTPSWPGQVVVPSSSKSKSTGGDTAGTADAAG